MSYWRRLPREGSRSKDCRGEAVDEFFRAGPPGRKNPSFHTDPRRHMDSHRRPGRRETKAKAQLRFQEHLGKSPVQEAARQSMNGKLSGSSCWHQAPNGQPLHRKQRRSELGSKRRCLQMKLSDWSNSGLRKKLDLPGRPASRRDSPRRLRALLIWLCAGTLVCGIN